MHVRRVDSRYVGGFLVTRMSLPAQARSVRGGGGRAPLRFAWPPAFFAAGFRPRLAPPMDRAGPCCKIVTLRGCSGTIFCRRLPLFSRYWGWAFLVALTLSRFGTATSLFALLRSVASSCVNVFGLLFMHTVTLDTRISKKRISANDCN